MASKNASYVVSKDGLSSNLGTNLTSNFVKSQTPCKCTDFQPPLGEVERAIAAVFAERAVTDELCGAIPITSVTATDVRRSTVFDPFPWREIKLAQTSGPHDQMIDKLLNIYQWCNLHCDVQCFRMMSHRLFVPRARWLRMLGQFMRAT